VYLANWSKSSWVKVAFGVRDWLMGMAPPILKRINKRQSPRSDILDIVSIYRYSEVK